MDNELGDVKIINDFLVISSVKSNIIYRTNLHGQCFIENESKVSKYIQNIQQCLEIYENNILLSEYNETLGKLVFREFIPYYEDTKYNDIIMEPYMYYVKFPSRKELVKFKFLCS